MDLSVLEETNLKMLLYGDSGTGKTCFAASSHLIPQMQPVLYVNAEGGLISLRKPQFENKYDDLDVWNPLNTRQDSGQVLLRVEELHAKLDSEDNKYKTVVIDTLSELQRYGLMYLSKNSGLWSDVYRNPKPVTQPEYGRNKIQTDTLVRAFRDLPMNVIMITHAKRYMIETEGASGEEWIVPSLTGQQHIDVFAAMDMCWFFTNRITAEGGLSFRILTANSANVRAKDRFFTLPTVVDITGKELSDVIKMG